MLIIRRLNENNPEIHGKLLEAINCIQVGNRPERQEPRRKKRSPVFICKCRLT